MSGKKTTAKMISLMSRQSLKSSRMRNIFVTITIVLASALLTAILMFAMGQSQRVKNELAHRHQAGYYNLTEEQVAALEQDERIACQIQVKSGVLSGMDGFDVMPRYVSRMSDEIRVGELLSGNLPEKENEIAAQAEMLRKLGAAPAVGSSVTLSFYDGNTETFTVSGILDGSDTAKQFSVFFSESYAKTGSQLKDAPYEVYAKFYNAANLGAEECKELIYLVGSDAGIERKYIGPSRQFVESLSVDTQSVMLYGMVGAVILLACVLVIYGVFYLSVIGRIHQFVVGPSGCGKSTLLNIIAGLLEPSSGSVYCDGKEVKGTGTERGVVFQQYALFPWMTVKKNVLFGLNLQGIKGEEAEKRAMKYIKMVQLEDFVDHYPKELSGGMKQRVAIARAYAVNPSVLLMDEPFGALDAQTRTQLQTELLETWEKEQKTCFFITHDVDEAIILAQKVIIMSARPGRIKEIVDIDIPYPRTQETKMDPKFLELKNHIWGQVYQEYLEVRK